MAGKIRVIVHVVSSVRDVNGNTYHAARIINTETGVSIVCHTDGRDNPRSALMYHAGLMYGEVYTVEETLPKKQWQTKTKHWPVIYGDKERKLYQGLMRPDTVCPDGPQCPDALCIAARTDLGLL